MKDPLRFVMIAAGLTAAVVVMRIAVRTPRSPLPETPPSSPSEPPAVRTPITLNACDHPDASALAQVHRTALLTIHLPATFEQVAGPAAGDLRQESYPRYEWKG